MEEVIIILIVVQALFMAIGSYALAKEIKDTRKRLEAVSVIAFVLPLAVYEINIASKFPMAINDLVNFFEFYIYSLIANAISGAIVQMFEGLLVD